MKIVCFADLHGNFMKNPTKWIPEGDVLVFCGDFGPHGELVDLQQFVDWTRKLSYKHMIFVAGNHDWIFQNSLFLAKRMLEDAGIIYLENQEVMIEGLKFHGTPVQNPFKNWAFMYNAARRKYYYSQIPDDTDILITHCPPRFILDLNTKGEHCGCEILADEVLHRIKPRYHIFGHLHEDGGKKESIKGIEFVNCSLLDGKYKLKYKALVIKKNRRKK